MPKTIWICLIGMLFVIGCRNTSDIRQTGLRYVEIGSALPDVGEKEWFGMPIRDSLITEGDYSWRVVVMPYKEGQILFEENVFDRTLLTRIRIETGDLSFRKDIRVGSTVEDLRSSFKKWEVFYMAEYELFDLSLRRYPSIHFLVQDKERAKNLTELELVTIEQLASEAKVLSIVIL